jgi:hypothetical protein
MSLSADDGDGGGATDGTSASRKPTDDYLDHLGNLPFDGKNSGPAGKMVIDDYLGNLPSNAGPTTTSNGEKRLIYRKMVKIVKAVMTALATCNLL